MSKRHGPLRLKSGVFIFIIIEVIIQNKFYVILFISNVFIFHT